MKPDEPKLLRISKAAHELGYQVGPIPGVKNKPYLVVIE